MLKQQALDENTRSFEDQKMNGGAEPSISNLSSLYGSAGTGRR
jgi:hypothetical protein